MAAVRLASVVALVALLGPPLAPAGADPGPDPDLDVLFVGAHPDDEASLLSTFGRWRQDHQIRTGVVTITRGEGGGNAVGPEEGPALGLLREGEERRAVGGPGITDVYNLDEPDLYYTVSAPLTEQAWNHDEVLGKLVRVVRQTRPEVVITMDPAPTPGNHGNHQYAARLAIEAHRRAADPAAFPEQLDEGLTTWAARRVLSNAAGAEEEVSGPECEQRSTPADSPGPEYYVHGISGGTNWEQRERVAEREYRSQGWASRPDIPDDPARVGCDHLTEIANRAPHVPGAQGADAPLLGALLPVPGGLPVGTGLVATAEPRVVPGQRTEVRVQVTAPPDAALRAGRIVLGLPPEWEVRGDGSFGPLEPGATAHADLSIAVPERHRPERVRIPVRAESHQGRAEAELRLDVVPPVVAEQVPLPGVAEFQRWAGGSLLRNQVPLVQTVPALGAQEVRAAVHNYSGRTRSGAVEFVPPPGFEVLGAVQRFGELGPGEQAVLTFTVRSTDPEMPTGVRGGDHPYTLITRTDDGTTAQSSAALELVPSTTIPQTATPPVVDGEAGPQEYPGAPLDASSLWEGEECAATDCAANARFSWHDGTLHALVDVVDDQPGALLAADDCKRHWRTDSVEITIDPKADSENTSNTFKVAVLPRTSGPGAPCYARDADNHQGPGEQTAPGVEIASKPRDGGYTVELAIPMRVLPGSVDPQRLGLNVLVYDSDTQDLTGQSRIGWSTWAGVQGDPYRWGRAVLQDAPADEQAPPPAPVLPLDALSSVDSSWSVAQSFRLKTSLGGAPPAGDSATRITSARAQQREVHAQLDVNGPGRAHLFVLDANDAVLAEHRLDVDGHGERAVQIPVLEGIPAKVLVGFATPSGTTAASAADVR
ncbi:N-acetylglucosaminyl deacetylase, LmbE family [Saccharopolyspora kobensis]|uniref:N-acetylglucosaminyl deacetylase, LmbE family n=2 Tax=Saccharopolyspora kobensis TaxID=146035 RepID=A0A1H5ZP24_9PSEU|nr:sugar-binding protein [Saccharopolyspora kobensis]SEG37961.1 N-acetylglucosaminyl deacetylase, LmbE family [Saccharopolyspora kobensis]SFF22003.1 N-acetylglucosaminyl deacetylase, LmbE family [Saccharopolyspora kobensis]